MKPCLVSVGFKGAYSKVQYLLESGQFIIT